METKMYHYTYKIHYSTGLFYIGVRSSECVPEDDTKYIGSSKNTPNELLIKKEILGIFDTREDALQNEMKHHIVNDVVKNKLYYNLALQNGTGFDCTGKKQTPEHIEKRTSKRIGCKHSEEAKRKIGNANRGRKHKPHTEEHRQMMSKMLKGRVSPFKGKKFSDNERISSYHSRLKYPEEREWYNRKTGETFMGNPQELALILGVDNITLLTRVISGKVKSYHGWYLKLETD